MGKIRVKKRTRGHLKAKSNAGSRNNDLAISHDVSESEKCHEMMPDVVPLPEVIMKTLPVLPLSVHSEAQTQTVVDGSASKKDRRKMRHERWLQKIDTCRLMKEASQAAEKRRKTVVVGDLQPLASALPQLTPMAPSSKARKETSTKPQKTTL